MSFPRVGVVVVNYFDRERTLRCLRALQRTDWPQDRLVLALVDNGSAPGFHAEVRRFLPHVRLVESPRNRGFGGGCNLGIEALADCEYIALLNNDATPEPHWLEPLVEVLRTRLDVGGVTPKLLLDGSFATVVLRASGESGADDPRQLGVQLCGARADGEDVSDRIHLVTGFWGWEHDATTVGGAFAWSTKEGRAHLALPASSRSSSRIALRLASGTGPKTVEVILQGLSIELQVGVEPRWYEIGDAPRVNVINNVGIVLHPDGSVADRGYLAVDHGQFNEPTEIFGWSGAAVVLSQRFLHDVGAFDDRFFLYYEDTDLSWRGRLRGWTYWYEPASVVRHEHSATVGHRAPMAVHLSLRNRLVMLTKCAPPGLAATAMAETARQLLEAVDRDVLRRLFKLKPPIWSHVISQANVIGGVVRLLPHALRERRSIRRTALRSDDFVRAFSAGNTDRAALRIRRGPRL